MSIAARIVAASREENGVRIYLAPLRKGDSPGQKSLLITNFPEDQSPYGLVGVEIWGGSGEILIGEKVWAERRGYTHIVLVKSPSKDGRRRYEGEQDAD